MFIDIITFYVTYYAHAKYNIIYMQSENMSLQQAYHAYHVNAA